MRVGPNPNPDPNPDPIPSSSPSPDPNPNPKQAEAHALVLRCVEGLLHGVDLSLPQLLQAYRDALGRVLAKVHSAAPVCGRPPPRAALYHTPEVAPPSYLAALEPAGGDQLYVARLDVGAAAAGATAATTTRRLLGPPPPWWEPASEAWLSAPAAVPAALPSAVGGIRSRRAEHVEHSRSSHSAHRGLSNEPSQAPSCLKEGLTENELAWSDPKSCRPHLKNGRGGVAGPGAVQRNPWGV